MLARPTLLARLGLLVLSSLLLTFAYAPYSQFYLAWIGVVPWLLALRGTRNAWHAFGWGFIGACMFNFISLLWLFHATLLGTVVLIGYMSLFCGLAAAILHGTRVLDVERARWRPAISMVLIALIWTGCEWFRGWLFNGFQWMFLGQTQSPIVVMCQVADLGGVFAVTFWVMCVNALVFVAACGVADRKTSTENNVNRSATPQAADTPRAIFQPIIAVAAIVLSTFLYGYFRIAQTSTTPGPRVMVVQPNFAHERGGARKVGWDDQTTYHFTETQKALASTNHAVDLIVWSETVLPAMNNEARRRANDPRLAHGIHDDLLALVRQHSTSLVFGAYSLLSFTSEADADVRNSTYLYSAFRDDQPRYDKIHLVPYGESVPFKKSFPLLHKLMFQMAAYSVNYLITAGAFDDFRVFDLPTRESKSTWRFVTPVCFEDIDGRLVSAMFRPTSDAPCVKRADLIVNISNDGWFKGNMRRQHFQNAVFRSIENRVPTARADNTGISGYIDSVGRVDWDSLLTEDTSGVRTKQVQIDPRLTFYTRFGDVFGALCFVIGIATWICVRALPRFRTTGFQPVGTS